LATRHATHTFLLLVRPHPKFLRAQAHDVPCLGLYHQCRVQEKAAMFFRPQWTEAFALALVSVVEFRRVADHQILARWQLPRSLVMRCCDRFKIDFWTLEQAVHSLALSPGFCLPRGRRVRLVRHLPSIPNEPTRPPNVTQVAGPEFQLTPEFRLQFLPRMHRESPKRNP